MAKKKPFGGRSLSSFRKSVGLDKDKSKASTTKQERDRMSDKQKNRVQYADELVPPTTETVATEKGFEDDFKKQQTSSTFIKDLKEAYKAGLYSGGTKAKAFMEKYNLKPGELAKLRVGIDQGLGQIIGKDRTNVLQEMVDGLRAEGILTTSGASAEFLKQRASDIFEPGMTKYDRDPITGLMGLSPVANIGIAGLDLIAGGSDRGLKGFFYGREKGLEGEELDNFAAAIANDRDLYNQMMTTPEMQQYQLDEFRAEANKNMMANRRDPDPISGTQPGAGGGDDSGGSDDGTTDPGSSYTPVPQNTYTFFDPNLGRYRSGTYDEYLQYVTAKDGGIIQLENGGETEEEQFVKDNKMVNLRNILEFIRQNKEMPVNTEDQKKVQDETSKLLGDMLKERFTDQEGITELSIQSGDAVRMAEEDQPARGILNIEVPSDSGPALREDLGLMGKIKDSGMSLLMEALRKSDISTGSANQFIEEALNNFVAAGVIPPNTSYDQLTDPFKDLVTREAAMIANSMATKQEISMINPTPISDKRPVNPDTNDRIDDMMRDQFMNQLYNQALDYEMQKERDGGTTIRDPQTNQITAFNVADGGIIGLKQGGMNDMMQADSLMFRDPSDEGQWEYNV